MAHQPFPNRFVRGSVHNALGGDECQHATFTKHIHALDEKVIVQGHACHLACRLVRLAEDRVEDGDVPERNVAAHHVEIALEFGLNFLKSTDAYLVVGMQGGKQLSRQNVFLKAECGMPFGCDTVKRADKLAHSCRRVEYLARGNTCLLQGNGNLPYYGFRCIESGHHRVFQTLHIAFVLSLRSGVVPNDPMQFHNQGEEFHFRLVPACDVLHRVCR